MQDISGFNTSVELQATVTFPQGFTITAAADDVDFIDIPSIAIAEVASGVNGDMVSWSKANPLPVSISVIPGTDEDINLAILLTANRVAKGQVSARDTINATVIFPDGAVTTLTKGKILEGMPANSVASAGRLKTKTYKFAFEGISHS